MIISRPKVGAIWSLTGKARACDIIQVKVQLSRAQMGKRPPHKMEQHVPEASREMDTRGGSGCRLPTSLCHRQDALRASRRALGRRRLRRSGRRLHPAPVRQEGLSGKEGTTPAAATPGLCRQAGAGPAPGSSESGLPSRAAPWGPPDGPAARPATQAGNGRRGCQRSVRRGRGRCGPALRGRGRGAEAAG